MAKINRCMVGLSFGFNLRGCQDVTKSFLVLQDLKGWRRPHVVEDTRRPMSFQLLQELGEHLGGICSLGYEVVPFGVFILEMIQGSSECCGNRFIESGFTRRDRDGGAIVAGWAGFTVIACALWRRGT